MQVLDHGYVKLVETWGSDERIIESARMSTNKGFEGWGPYQCMNCHDKGYTDSQGLYINEAARIFAADNCKTCKGAGYTQGDERLLRYLYEHKHMTPFEMAGMTLEIQAPIFVFREWHRHRTQSYNELSARYTPLPDLNYVPTVERLMLSGGSNKQAQGLSGEMTPEKAENFRRIVSNYYGVMQVEYQAFLGCGVPKELARLLIPVGRYSRMRASANLRNWLGFLTLRMEEHAQWEIRQYANVVGQIVAEHFPRTWGLFHE